MQAFKTFSRCVFDQLIKAQKSGCLGLLSEHLPRLILLAFAFLCSVGFVQAFETLSRCVFRQLIKLKFWAYFWVSVA